MSIVANSIVTVNAGSSSIKITVFAMNQVASEMSRLLDVSISTIGEASSQLRIQEASKQAFIEEVDAPSHIIASDIIIERLERMIDPSNILAIGHRVVHGGLTHNTPTLIDNISKTDWELMARLDPEHTPATRQLIAQFANRYPSLPQIACFDTAFFRDLPRVATIVPIPSKYYAAGVRRYGFHGLSYMSLLATFQEKAGVLASNGRVILAHLGSGASLAAVHSGKPVDMTMGFTPASGIVMSTRSGDLDPSVFNFLHTQDTMSSEEFRHMVNFESGLLGVSNLTGDMQTLLAVEGEDKDVAMAVELFVHDVMKSIGALATTLGGVDSLIFSGGIGEQSAILRARICQNLGYIGINIDQEANERHAFLISAEHSRVGVHVISTNEAQVIATQTRDALNEKSEV